MLNILIAGGSGLIGQQLCKWLINKGYKVAILSRTRNQKTEIFSFYWNLENNEIENQAIEWADVIINLAGENIGDKRWTAKRKQQINDSRTKSGELIFNKLQEQDKKLNAYISASAIGYYGTITSNKIFNESDPAANDFLGNSCKQWEDTANLFNSTGIRTVILRTGVVLTKQGGALSKMIVPIKIGIGSALGTGKQYMPWIHIDDLCKIHIKSIEDSKMKGIYNAVAPEHISNYNFSKTIALTLKKPFLSPNIPAFVLKLFFGEMSEILLKGSRVSADKIQATGYHFVFPTLKSALGDLV